MVSAASTTLYPISHTCMLGFYMLFAVHKSMLSICSCLLCPLCDAFQDLFLRQGSNSYMVSKLHSLWACSSFHRNYNDIVLYSILLYAIGSVKHVCLTGVTFDRLGLSWWVPLSSWHRSLKSLPKPAFVRFLRLLQFALGSAFLWCVAAPVSPSLEGKNYFPHSL